MHQPPALHHAETTTPEWAAATGDDAWESDLADIATLPLTAVDGLAPLRVSARLLTEVLRARGGIKGGSDQARAE